MPIWNGKKFVDALPQTSAAEARVSGKTTDAKDCGCSTKSGARSVYTTWDIVPSANRSATVDRAWKRAKWTDRDGVVDMAKKR